MYAKRNTIYLIIAILLIIASGFVLSNNLKKKHAKISVKNSALLQQYEESDKIAKTLPEVQFMYDSLRTRWLFAPKKILDLPEPQLTVSYMVWLTQHYNLDLPFEFRIEEIQKMDIISNFAFTLSGVSTYDDLYTFIYYMTQNPLLYKFEHFNLRRNEEGKIEYEIRMKGFYLERKVVPGEQFNFAMQQAKDAKSNFKDIFYTTYVPPSDEVVSDTAPAAQTSEEIEIDSGLVDPERSSLLALTSTTAYVLNEKGEMERLTPGSPVAGGSLSFIDQQRSEAQFILYGGKRITLGLGYTK